MAKNGQMAKWPNGEMANWKWQMAKWEMGRRGSSCLQRPRIYRHSHDGIDPERVKGIDFLLGGNSPGSSQLGGSCRRH
jgi:hypothetical protein